MATKYVRKSGTDSGSSGPFLTIQYGVDQLDSGDTLVVGNGVYKEKVQIVTSNVSIRAENNQGAIIDGTWDAETYPCDSHYTSSKWLVNSEYDQILGIGSKDFKVSGITISGFTVRNVAARGIEVFNADDIIIENCEVYNIFGNTVRILGFSQSKPCKNIIVRNNHCYWGGLERIWNSKNATCTIRRTGAHPTILTTSLTDTFEVYGNIVHDNGGEGINCAETRKGHIYNNRVWNCESMQCYLVNTSETLVERNIFFHDTNGFSKNVGPKGGRHGIVLRDERQYDNKGWEKSQNNTIVNNLIVNIILPNNSKLGTPAGLQVAGIASLKNCLIANNTFYNCAMSLDFPGAKASDRNWTGCEIKNNIFVPKNTHGNADDTNIDWGYNCWGTKSPPAQAEGLNDVYLNPQLVNPNVIVAASTIDPNNYKLKASSPCINSGIGV